MDHQKHSYLMIGLLVVGAGLFFSGTVAGGALLLLWPLACIAMMYMMMRAMGGMGGMNAKQPTDHTHDDGVTHSHDDALTHTHQ